MLEAAAHTDPLVVVDVVFLLHPVEHQVLPGLVFQIDQGGDLEWVPKEKVYSLPIWEGDKIFFRLLEEGRSFFSLKLSYDAQSFFFFTRWSIRYSPDSFSR